MVYVYFIHSLHYQQLDWNVNCYFPHFKPYGGNDSVSYIRIVVI